MNNDGLIGYKKSSISKIKNSLKKTLKKNEDNYIQEESAIELKKNDNLRNNFINNLKVDAKVTNPDRGSKKHRIFAPEKRNMKYNNRNNNYNKSCSYSSYALLLVGFSLFRGVFYLIVGCLYHLEDNLTVGSVCGFGVVVGGFVTAGSGSSH